MTRPLRQDVDYWTDGATRRSTQPAWSTRRRARRAPDGSARRGTRRSGRRGGVEEAQMNRRGLVIVVATVWIAGCTFSSDIVMRHKDGREAVCEHVTGIGGVRTHTLLTVQRQGYERVPVN
jgi:hypothetical protein